MSNTEKAKELEDKLHDAIDKMIDSNGGNLTRVVYYHSGATFIETGHGKFMLRLVPYNPSTPVIDEFEKPQ